jgi:hypothetical protein
VANSGIGYGKDRAFHRWHILPGNVRALRKVLSELFIGSTNSSFTECFAQAAQHRVLRGVSNPDLVPDAPAQRPVSRRRSRKSRPRTPTFRAYRLLDSRQLHQHLSQLLAPEQLEKGPRRIFDALLHTLFPHELAIAHPRGQVLAEFR